MNPIDLFVGFLVGLAAGALLRGALNDALGAAADHLAPDDDEHLADFGGCYPRIDTAPHGAAPTTRSNA